MNRDPKLDALGLDLAQLKLQLRNEMLPAMVAMDESIPAGPPGFLATVEREIAQVEELWTLLERAVAEHKQRRALREAAAAKWPGGRS